VLFIVCNYLKYHRKKRQSSTTEKNTIFHANLFVHKFNMLNSNIESAIQSYKNKQAQQTSGGKQHWSQKCQEATELIELFREFDKDNSKGISPYYTKSKDVIENVYKPIKSLHKYKEHCFYSNYKRLVRSYELEKASRRNKPASVETNNARLASELFIFYFFLFFLLYFQLTSYWLFCR
jgi:hypothetical protein